MYVFLVIYFYLKVLFPSRIKTIPILIPNSFLLHKAYRALIMITSFSSTLLSIGLSLIVAQLHGV
ncbi:hypothetical protein SAMN06264346_104216 [Chryseobacterium profundimaris]|uniref:Uncharacterized protein n=1 Tax=Chryseobacterium profundimaris TaxID=1387275 RepID=A0ABY1NUG0_9FLAO|nr:hypothetical protein SAMN06264346_104216 [Chryseobacterium profundimaris]